MSKLFFLLIFKLVAAMQNSSQDGNNVSNPQINITDAPPTHDTEASSSTSPFTRFSLELVTPIDMNILRQTRSAPSSLDDLIAALFIDVELPVFCGQISDVHVRAFEVNTRQYESEDQCVIQTTLRDLTFCFDNPKPIVQRLTEKDPNSGSMRDKSCGPKHKKGSMFSFGYPACEVNAHLEKMRRPLPLQVQENSDFFEVYRFCHSEKDKAVIYTEHTIHNPEFLTGLPLSLEQKEDEKYEMMIDGFGHFGSRYENVGASYKKLKEGRIFVLVQAQQLVPVDDMAFTLKRKPTYHYLNIAPMNINQFRLWNYMNYLIREDARKNGRKFSINTGAFIINSEKKKESTEISIKEVDVWIKIVRYEEKAFTTEEKNEMKSLAIVMNTGLDETKFKEFNDSMCTDNLCENAFVSFQTFSGTRELVCCCSTMKLAEVFFDKELGTESSFKIDSFTETKTMSMEQELEHMKKILNFFPKLM